MWILCAWSTCNGSNLILLRFKLKLKWGQKGNILPLEALSPSRGPWNWGIDKRPCCLLYTCVLVVLEARQSCKTLSLGSHQKDRGSPWKFVWWKFVDCMGIYDSLVGACIPDSFPEPDQVSVLIVSFALSFWRCARFCTFWNRIGPGHDLHFV